MNLQRSVRLDKNRTRRRLENRKDKHMNNRPIYALLVRSEEKSRDMLETAVYAMCILSAVFAIWQFAQQPNPLPMDGVSATSGEHSTLRQTVS
jgi:hypothetical protein